MAIKDSGTTDHGQPLPGEGSDLRLRCPKDATIMEKIEVGTVTIDRCGKCGAMWFDALELQKVLAFNDASKAVGNSVGKNAEHAPVCSIDPEEKRMHSTGRALAGMVCPRDRSMLIDIVDQQQPHIHEKSCTVCGGILLDAGELQDLSEFTLKERIKGLFKR